MLLHARTPGEEKKRHAWKLQMRLWSWEDKQEEGGS
jgi:hypothetical protein